MRYSRLPQKWMAYLFLVALVGGMWPGIILGPGRAEGLVTPPDMPIMPIGVTVGVIQGQMLRASFFNRSTETVQVAFELVNFQGDAIGPKNDPISLGPGKGTFMDIPGKDIFGLNDTRVEVTGIVRIFASQKTLKAVGGNLAASLQVLDETTHGTALILPFMNIAGVIGPGM
jgi:hypothetical protein